MANEVTIVVKVRNETKPEFAAIKADAGRAGDDSGTSFGKGFSGKLLKGVADIAPQFAGSIAKTMASAGSASGPILVAGIAAAAPLIANTLGAAVIGGSAGLGIIGGVLLASKDPRVAAAGQSLGENLLGSLKADASPFVAPLLKSIAMIQGAFDQLRPHIQSIFANSAKFVEPLVGSILKATGFIVAALDVVISRAGPVMDVLGHGFEQIGQAVAGFMEDLSAHSDDAAVALQGVFDTVTGLIDVMGPLVSVISQVSSVLTDMFGGTMGALGTISNLFSLFDGGKDKADGLAGATGGAATGIQNMGTAAHDAYSPVNDLATALENAETASHNLFDADTNVERALDKVTESAKKNGTTLDKHTEKGRNNRDAISDLVTEMHREVGAYEAVNGKGEGSIELSGRLHDALVNKVSAAFGISKRAAEKYVEQLGDIPASKNTKVNAQTSAASAQIYALKNQIAQLKGKTITITTNEVHNSYRIVHDNADKLKYAHGGIRGAASGGTQNGLTWVGEEGPELVDLPTGSNVHTTGDSRRMVGASAVSQAGPTINLYVQGSIRSDRDLVALIRNEFQRGGFRGVVNTA